ncbi:MAG: acyltransferase, partial [Gallintestinimicrobium sp.]
MRKQNVVPERRFTRREYSTAHFGTHRARKEETWGKPGRQANFELLRIIAMFMVVILHWKTRTADCFWMSEALLTGAGVWSLVTESVCIVAVNVYVLISGYFLSSCTFSFRRVAQVLVQTLFYTVLIPPVLALVGVLSWSEVLNPYHIWNSIFPVQSGHYWFVSAYVVLCLLSPFFNAGLETLSQKRMQQLLAALLFFFCIGKSISPLQVALDRFGYDFGWFAVLYLTGGYLKKYGMPRLNSFPKNIVLYAGCTLGTFLLELLLLPLAGRLTGLTYYASVPFHYNALFAYLAAVGLFGAFAVLKVEEGRFADMVRFWSPAVFGVYLIHQQTDIAPRWFAWVNALTGRLGD